MTNKQLAEPRKEARTLRDLLNDPSVMDGFKAVATTHLTPEKMTRLVINAVSKVPKLQQCSPASVLGAVMTSTSLGLEINSPKGHAYLIPYDKRGKLPDGKWGVISTECQFIIGYRGFVALAHRNKNLIKLTASAIYENDEFDHCEGSEAFLRHKPAMVNRGKLIGSYCYAKFTNEHGHEADIALVLSYEELEKIRSKSETYEFLKKNAESETNWKGNKKTAKEIAYAQKKFDETPWVQWEGEMAAKSAIRRMVKQLPLDDSFQAAATIDGLAESGQMDLNAMNNADFVGEVIDGTAIPEIEENEEAAEDAGDDAAEKEAATGDNAPNLPAPGKDKKPAAKKAASKKAAAKKKPADDDDLGFE